MKTKPTMHYRVIASRNPKTGGTLYRPVVTGRKTLSVKQLVAYAIASGYVHGRQAYMEGVFGAFIDAMKDRVMAGYSISVKDWLTVAGQLKGIVGDDLALTPDNEYHIAITPSKNLKVDINDFAWTRVGDEDVVIGVANIISPNGQSGEVVKAKAIVVSGKNLSYNAAWGDSVKVSYEGLEAPITLTPSEQSASFLRFDWPTALADVPVGTELVFEFRLHGKAEGVEQVSVKTVTLVAA